MKVGIIGAGPAGLACAYSLAKKGVDVSVFESGSLVGGMAKSVNLWGQTVDLGPHRFFSNDPRVNRFWLEAVDMEYAMVDRLTRIFYKKTFFDYPLKATNALFGLGVFEAIRCVLSYLWAKVSPPADLTTFEGWVVSRFGRRLFSIFFLSYTEKLWGIKVADLDADFAAQRIKKFSLFEAIKSALFQNRNNNHKTLVDEFAYPLAGAGSPYFKLESKIKTLGSSVHINRQVAKVAQLDAGQQVKIIFEDGSEESFDHVVSTMPLTHLVQRLDAPESVQAATKSLTFRNTILVYLRLSGPNPFPDQWIYVHEAEMQTGRISNFSNWVPEIKHGESDHVLCLEYWCYDGDEIWSISDEKLIEIAKSDIAKTGLISKNAVVEGKVQKVPKCYPVYNSGYKERLAIVQDFVDTVPNITAIGRYGAFKYNNQDHSILMGILAAENLADGKSNDLWGVNTDYEYQESSRITSIGLVND